MTTMNPFDPRSPKPRKNVAKDLREMYDHPPVIYICARHPGNTEEDQRKNVEKVREYANFAIDSGAIPLAAIFFHPDVGTEDPDGFDGDMRAAYAADLIPRCDELWLFAEGGLSDGMMVEILDACDHRIFIRLFDENMKEVYGYEPRD